MKWIKSSRSSVNVECVEVAWQTASKCGESTHCIQVGHQPDGVLVRDSKDPDGPVLRFSAAEWQAFLAGVNAGEFTPGTPTQEGPTPA